MQSLRRCVRGSISFGASLNKQLNIAVSNNLIPVAAINTSSILRAEEPTKFTHYNKKIFPVQSPDEEKRPAYVCHVKANVKYSWKKMWYIACLVRGMSVDEAVKQLSFVGKKGAAIAKETILEAQQKAVAEHNVEFKSNLWVAESFCSKGVVYKALRRHARGRAGEIRYGYIHYFVRLEEGKPPKHYYLPEPKEKDDLLEAWLEKKRMRKFVNSL